MSSASTSSSFLVLSPALPLELLTYILSHDIYPTTLIICATRADFIATLASDARSETARQSSPPEHGTETAGEHGDESDREARRYRSLVSASPLYQVATSRHIRVVYVPTVTHLRAYLSVFSPDESPVPAPPAGFRPPRDERPRIILFGLLDMHRDTSEWSAQGLSNTLSAIVEVAHRLSWQAAVVEPRNRNSSPALEDILKEHVPFLSGGGRRPGLDLDEGGWTGRTVEVGRVMKRWFRFERGPWDTSSGNDGT
ncbi:hypothetical protein GGR52DRAFT_346430 [Hypoxylon sp. FL1284]|nr:hypothetical protein GGR52DRAFT_346430 [Hypoxylon sp. FL1284]